MEPFNLSLQQVNFEEKDITEDDTLDSFSNLVCFDSDFKNDKSNASPVSGRNVSFLSKQAPSKQRVVFSSPYDSGEEVFQTKHHMVSSITSHTSYSRRHGDTMAIEPSGDSFLGFTDTVEALALQKSVIGSSNVKPASDEAIAKAIAEAKQKLLATNDTLILDNYINAVPSDVFTPDDDVAVESADSSSVVTEYRKHKQKIRPTNQINAGKAVPEFSTSFSDIESERRDTESVSSISSTDVPADSPDISHDSLVNPSPSSVQTDSSVHSDSILFVSNNGTEESGYFKQLIHIPADQLDKEVERKSSSWFGSKEQVKTHKESKTKVKISQEKLVSVGSVSRTNSPKTSVNTNNVQESNNEHRSSVPRHSSDNNHHVVTTSDVESITSNSHGGLGDHSQSPTHSLQSPTHSLQSPTHSLQSPTHSLQSPTHSLHVESRASDSHSVKETTSGDESRVTHLVESRHVINEDSLTVTREVNITREMLNVPSPVSSRHSSPSKYRRDSQDGASLRADLDKALREKAKLEGHIEVLEQEVGYVIKARALLQAQVATLQQQVKSAEGSVSVVQRERDALSTDMETLRVNRSRLEQVIMDARKLLEDKDQDIKTLAEDLKLSHQANNKLQQKFQDVRVELTGKNSTVRDMKNKIAELYVDFQMSNQNKILGESEIKSLQGEIKSLAVAKEWYKKQLQLSQDAKGVLQKEVSTTKREMIAQTTMVERLKADNIHIKLLLTEAEQRALSEKEKLARHLEAIESHMMEREVTFAQLQQQKESMEMTLQQRLDRGQHEIPAEVADELKKAQNELRRRQAHISMLEHEQADLMKRLTLSQESILDRDKTIEYVGRKSVDTEILLQQSQLALREKEDELLLLKNDKSRVEVEATALREEKLSTSSALQTLKTDMGKVENSFKHMKQELKSKQEEIDVLMSDNARLTQGLEDSQKAIILAKQQDNLSKQQDNLSKQQGNLSQESLQMPAVILGEGDISNVEDLQNNLAILQARDAEMVRRLEAVRSESAMLIEELRSENVKFEKQVVQLTKQVEEYQAERGSEVQVSEVNEPSNEVKEPSNEVKEPSNEVKELVHSLEVVHRQLTDLSSQTEVERSTYIDQLHGQQVKVEAFLSNQNLSVYELSLVLRTVITQNVSIVRMMYESQQHNDSYVLEGLQKQESEYKSLMEQLNERLATSEYQNNGLQQKLATSEYQNNELKERLATSEYQNNELQQKLREITEQSNSEIQSHGAQLDEQKQLCEQLTATVTELRQQLDSLKRDGDLSAAGVTVALQDQVSELRSKQATLETESHREIAKQQAKALKFGKDLEAALKTSHQQKHTYERSITEYEEKQRIFMSDNLKLTEQLKEAQANFSLDLDEKTTHLQHELHEVHQHYEEKTTREVELREIVHRHEVDMASYLTRIEHLEMELQGAEEALRQYRDHEEESRLLVLELEREKGRLAGTLHSHTTLKEHTSSLEVALAQHESSTIQAKSEVQQELDMTQREVTHLTDEFEQLYLNYNNEKENSQDLKKQLLTEKGNHVKIRRQLESLLLEHNQLKLEVETGQEGIKSLTEELNKVNESDNKHRAECEHLSQEVKLLRDEKERYFSELEARRNKEPIVLEEIQSLEWQIKEKETEIAAFKEQLTVVDLRQQMETNTLAMSLQTTKQTLCELREENLSVKDEKIRLQARIAELKGALQASLEHTKLLQENQGSGSGAGMTFDLASLENLLTNQTSNSISSKPLSFLQATLSNLRGEITGLQSQVDEHALVVQTTSMAWKELEAQVHDLREVCKTSAADRAVSQKLLDDGFHLTKASPEPSPEPS